MMSLRYKLHFLNDLFILEVHRVRCLILNLDHRIYMNWSEIYPSFLSTASPVSMLYTYVLVYILEPIFRGPAYLTPCEAFNRDESAEAKPMWCVYIDCFFLACFLFMGSFDWFIFGMSCLSEISQWFLS